MHELSIASAIVATVERHADGNSVTAVRVRVGRLRQVVPDSLEFCFGMVARDSVCEGARLELEVVPAVLRCAACEHEWEIEEPPFWCPECAGGEVAAVRGEELEVESIEIETGVGLTEPAIEPEGRLGRPSGGKEADACIART